MILRPHELVVDNFAGGGGASAGIALAIGRSPDVAINHDPEAVAMHAANHPETLHLCQNVWKADPREVCRGRAVGLAWFSPDCKHFSKAKGGQPVKRNIRDLAWAVVHWARLVRPRIICLENVEEFKDWGPLVETEDGKLLPCPLQRGLTFKRWVRELTKLGYAVEWRELRACDYGAPTIRKRLFLVARCDGLPIVWPAPTHGPGLRPWRTAAECIDWSIPCPSIFGRKRPLAEATLRRIARGIRRYVIEAAEPFIVPVTHAGDSRVQPIDEPLRTVSCAARGEHALVTPFFAPRYGEREGQEPRCQPVDAPISTIVPTANGAQLVAAFMEQANTGMVGHDARKPLSTIVSRGTTQRVVTAAMISRQFSGSIGSPAGTPLGTVTAGGGGKSSLVTAIMSHAYSSNSCGGNGDPRQPMKTVTTGGHHALVQAFLLKYFATAVGQDLREPLHTATSKARFGLVTIAGTDWQIVDIGMRMLTPRELFRAQGFDDGYVIDPDYRGKPLTKTAQIRMCGNSVCPPVAAAVVAANFATRAAAAAE